MTNANQNLLAQLQKLTKEEQVEICTFLFDMPYKDNDGQIMLYTSYYPDGYPEDEEANQ